MTSDYQTSARAALAVAYPPEQGLKGAATTLRDLCQSAYRNPRFASLGFAGRLCVDRNFEVAIPYGNGNAAARRKKQLEIERNKRAVIEAAADDATNPQRFYPYTMLFPISTRLPQPLIDLDSSR